MPASSTKSAVALIEGDLLNLETRILQLQERLKPDSNLYGFLQTIRERAISTRYQLSTEAEQHINEELAEDRRTREKQLAALDKAYPRAADVSNATPSEKPKA
jgi:hypothetical protein